MKLDQDPRLPAQGSPGYERTLYARLYELFRNIALVSNNNADGVTALNEIAQAAQDAIAALGGDIESLNTALNSKANASHAHSTADISNLVGSVANGSIIERGSNANGEYVKFLDGTLICSGISEYGYFANSSNYTFNINFPSAFSVNPDLTCSLIRRIGAISESKLWQNGASNTILINTLTMSTAQTFLMFSGSPLVSGDRPANLRYVAVGRWK